MKDAVATMGGLLPDDAGGRDAVHVAVISVKAGERLYPGQDIGVISNGAGEGIASTGAKHVGIVDPFLRGPVFLDQRFWLYLYPRTITGLNHQWKHPDFDDDQGSVYGTPASKLASEKWLRDFCGSNDCPSYETVIGAIKDNAEGYNDEYLFFRDIDAHAEIPPEFWVHAEIVIGRPLEKRPAYFSCSC